MKSGPDWLLSTKTFLYMTTATLRKLLLEHKMLTPATMRREAYTEFLRQAASTTSTTLTDRVQSQPFKPEFLQAAARQHSVQGCHLPHRGGLRVGPQVHPLRQVLLPEAAVRGEVAREERGQPQRPACLGRGLQEPPRVALHRPGRPGHLDRAPYAASRSKWR